MKQEKSHLQLNTGCCFKKETANGDFERLLLEAIDESLASLGDFAKYVIYFCLERRFQMKKREIPSKVDEFADAIEKILGEGAKLLEIQIMRLLHEKVQGSFKYYPMKGELVFTEYIQALKTFQNDWV
jgi:hypothetical protein